jgi:hypothetical protein
MMFQARTALFEELRRCLGGIFSHAAGYIPFIAGIHMRRIFHGP